MSERDTDIDELATGETLVDLPAIPRTDPPDRLSSGGHTRITTREEDAEAGIAIPPDGKLPSQTTYEPMFRALQIAQATQEEVTRLAGLVEDALRERQEWQRERVRIEDQIIDISSVLTAILIRGETVPGRLVGKTVLIGEDSDILRRSLARAFERCGATVLQAYSVESARDVVEQAAARGEQIDGAVVDVRLPEGGSGVRVARFLRATMPRCQVVFLTGGSTEHLRQVAVDLRASLLRKPCELLTMVEAIEARAAE